MVGIGGGIPSKVRLGDVVVGTELVQWDFGKAEKDGNFKRTATRKTPPTTVLTTITKLESEREMYGERIPHYMNNLKEKWPKLVPKYTWNESLKDPLFALDNSHCSQPGRAQRKPGDVHVHYGLIASGNQVIKDANFRDNLDENLGGDLLCVE